MKITVLSWNVWSENRKIDAVVDFLNSQHSNIMCLQEVSHELYLRLKADSAYHVYQAIDEYHGDSLSYLVIAGRHPLANTKKPHRSFKFKKGLRTFIARLFRWREGQEYHYVDMDFSLHKGDDTSSRIRFFNVHLDSAVGPWRRLRLFKQVLRRRDRNGRNIICGDFNVLNTWYAWLYRLILGSWGDAWVKERSIFLKLFKKRRLKNIFDGFITHNTFASQLDYILVPEEVEVLSKKIFEESYGSDHKPILVELEV